MPVKTREIEYEGETITTERVDFNGAKVNFHSRMPTKDRKKMRVVVDTDTAGHALIAASKSVKCIDDMTTLEKTNIEKDFVVEKALTDNLIKDIARIDKPSLKERIG